MLAQGVFLVGPVHLYCWRPVHHGCLYSCMYIALQLHVYTGHASSLLARIYRVSTIFFGILTSVMQAVASTIGVIKLSGKRLMQLINDLLDAAQLRKGQLVLKFAFLSVACAACYR